MMRTVAGLILALAALLGSAGAEVPPPSRSGDGLDRAFHHMYNLDFDGARLQIRAYRAAHPSDPRAAVAEASSWLFQEFERLHILQAEFFTSDDKFRGRQAQAPDLETKRRFDEALAHAETLSTSILAGDPSHHDALFCMALVNGLRADYTALIERRDLAALGYTKKASQWAEKLLAVAPDYYDAYLATGLGKYLVGLKPAPVRWLLRLGGIKGDRDQGMQELELAATRGRLLAPFARLLLAVGYIRQQQPDKAVELLSSLRDEFPGNPLFAREVARLQSAGAQKSAP
jgi:tetratricopeptide (TPR) repeat protein